METTPRKQLIVIHEGKDISTTSQQRWSRGRQNAIVVLVVALTLGTALALAFPAFRRERVLESNQDFFPQIKVETEPPREENATP